MASADLLAVVEARAPRAWRRRLVWLVLLAAAACGAWVVSPSSARRQWIDDAYAIAGLAPPAHSPTDGAAGPNAAVTVSRASNADDGGGARHGSTLDAGDDEAAVNEDGEIDAEDADAEAVRTAKRVIAGRPLAEWLAEIAGAASRGLILAPEISGEATATFDDGTGWEDRLAALSRIHGFRYDVGERLIEVWTRPREPATLDGSEGGGDADVQGQLPALGAAAADAIAEEPIAFATPPEEPEEPPRLTEVVRPVHARAEDVVSAVTKAARGSDVQVASDPGSNAVVIAGPEPGVLAIARLVYALDVPRRRFVLEAEIVELSRTAREELGVRWSIEGTVGAVVDFPAADTPGESAGIIIATDGAHALRARMGALEADGHVRVVSRPRVVALEGRPASIESVRILRVRFPERTAIVAEAEDAGTVDGGRAVEEIPVGVTLRVEPSMRGDGRIVLRIRAKSSTLGPPQPPDDIPEELSRMVDAEVAVADGETAVLGGLRREGMSHSGAGVPVLRSIPLLGLLFGKRQHEDDDEELVVLVTPRLLPS